MARVFFLWALLTSFTVQAANISKIDSIVASFLKGRYLPGAVVLVSHQDKIIHHQAYGVSSLETGEITQLSTLFDLASVSKVFTAVAVMKLIEQGKIKLSTKLSSIYSQFESEDRKDITIEMLLRHRSGIAAVNYLTDFTDDPEETWNNILSTKLVATPNSKFIYSDIGFLVLGKIVHDFGGGLDSYVDQTIFGLLGLNTAQYGPVLSYPSIAQTTSIKNIGIVHDPRSRALGGISGHAGVFATAQDLHTFITQLRTCDGFMMSKSICQQIKSKVAYSNRGLGVDIASPYSNSLRGDLFTDGFGHSGYTGTSFWVDNKTNTSIVILTNRVHSGDSSIYKKKIVQLRREIANAVATKLFGSQTKF